MMPWFMWSRVSSSSLGFLPRARLADAQLAARLLEPAAVAEADRDPDQDEHRQGRRDGAVDVLVAPIVGEHVMFGLADRNHQRISVEHAIGRDARDAVEAAARGEHALPARPRRAAAAATRD